MALAEPVAADSAREIWEATTDGGRLITAYGYVPSLHDASFEGFLFDPAANRLTVTIRYYDTIEGSEQVTLWSVFTFVFDDLVRCELRMKENDIWGSALSRTEEGFRLELQPGQLMGEIVARSIDIRICELPSREPTDWDDRFRLSIG